MEDSEYSRFGVELRSLLHLSKPPIAISLDADTSELERSTDTVPSSCTFWFKALADTFYTTPEQHNDCSIGAVTHGYRLAKDTVPGCGCEDVDLLASVGWLDKDDIQSLPSIPMNKQRKIAYSPLSHTRFEPDVVLIFCDAEQAMMIGEAAPDHMVTGKPTCQGLPEAFSGKVVIGLGCTPSRLRAGYDSKEIVVMLPGKDLKDFTGRLRKVVDANTKVVQSISSDGFIRM